MLLLLPFLGLPAAVAAINAAAAEATVVGDVLLLMWPCSKAFEFAKSS
jgi:hypothetical protein